MKLGVTILVLNWAGPLLPPTRVTVGWFVYPWVSVRLLCASGLELLKMVSISLVLLSPP